MMFHALSVTLSGILGHADGAQKRQHHLVAGARGVGDSATPFGQEYPAIGPAGDQPHRFDAGHGFDDSGMGNAETIGDVHRSRLALGIDQIGDHLDIILGHLRASRIASGAKVTGTLLGADVE